MENLTAIDKLADLLHDHAKPVVRPQRLAPSPIYDLDYRMTIIALAISIHGKTEADGSLRIESARLKLVQFVAQRPILVRALQRWARSSNGSDFLPGSSERLRRGYTGDSTYDQVVQFMVANGILRWDRKYLITIPGNLFLAHLLESSEREGMFTPERAVLQELKSIRITVSMLEGQ
jgi:hypothetical protein